MGREPVVGRRPEEYVGAAISRIATQDSDFATLREDGIEIPAAYFVGRSTRQKGV